MLSAELSPCYVLFCSTKLYDHSAVCNYVFGYVNMTYVAVTARDLYVLYCNMHTITEYEVKIYARCFYYEIRIRSRNIPMLPPL
jgi:hypothetical protein